MAGNTINVQGSYIDVHDNEHVYLSVDKAEVRMGQEVASEAVTEASDGLSEPLTGERAEGLKERLVEACLIDERWQPVGLSCTEQALLAKAVGHRLGIKEIWQVFGGLWGVKPSSLRAYFNRALNQKKSLRFQDRLKNAIG